MSHSVTIRVLFFGMLKEITGRSEEQLELPAGSTLADVFDHYAALTPRLHGMTRSIVLAQNHAFSQRSEPVIDNAEIAFLPPVSGGSGPWTHVIEDPAGHFFALTREVIDSRPSQSNPAPGRRRHRCIRRRSPQ